MSGFTDPEVNGFEFAKVAYDNEIVLAFEERWVARLTTFDPGATNPDLSQYLFKVGDDAQKYKYLAGQPDGPAARQENIESTLVPDYVDHTQDPDGASSVTMFTLATWRSVAGLHDDGNGLANGTSFRRVWEWDPVVHPTIPWGDGPVDTDALAWDYGYVQPGDIRGYWINQDFHKALSALQWTEVANWGYQDRSGKEGGGEDLVQAAAISEMETDYGNDAWGYPGIYVDSVYRSKVRVYKPYSEYEADEWRTKGKWYCRRLWTGRPCSASVYLYPHAPEGDYYIFQSESEAFGEEPMVEDRLWHFEDLASAQTEIRVTSLYGDRSVSPYSIFGPAPAIGPDDIWGRGVDVVSAHFILKWFFTH